MSSTSSTDENGEAGALWQVGPEGENTMSAEVAGEGIAGNPALFTATVRSDGRFNIALRFLRTPTTAQRRVFESAASRWAEVVVGGLSDVRLTASPGDCGNNSPAVDQLIDDVLILVDLQQIDGPGNVLASAGPCFIRVSDLLPIMGLMQFDVADLREIEEAGALEDVILHEMGHVLGVGALWDIQGLLAGASQLGGTDPHFTGARAVSAFDEVGGAGYAGQKVPVENIGGMGTADVHWRESVMHTELMTGFVALDPPSDANPLSIVTAASLGDLGYTVDMGAADRYTLDTALRALSGPVLRLGNDILRLPVRAIDGSGRVHRVLSR